MAEDNPTTAGSLKPHAQGQLNIRQDSQVVAPYEPTLLYFRPETGEIIVVPKEDAAEFENHSRELCKAVDDYHQANIEVSEAIAYYSTVHKGPDPSERANAATDVDSANTKMVDANDKLNEHLKQLDKISLSGKKIVELIPIRKVKGAEEANAAAEARNKAAAREARKKQQRAKKDKRGRKIRVRAQKEPMQRTQRQYGQTLTYVRSDKIKGGWKKVPLAGDDAKSGDKSILKKDKNGNNKVDIDKLKDQLSKPKIKNELFHIDGVSVALTSWAEAWNKDLHWDKQIGNRVDLSAEAQLMRFTTNCAANVEWEPSKGKVGIKAEGNAEIAIAEAKADAKFYIPDRLGYEMQFTGKHAIYPLGAFRMQIAVTLSGVVGASVNAEIGLEVEIKPAADKAKGEMTAAGKPTDKKKIFSMDPKTRIVKINGSDVDPSFKGEIGAFAGAKADFDIAGSLQWINPEKTGDHASFEDFVKLDPALAGLAGAGASAKFEIRYAKGQFHVVMSLSACLGLGLRGKVDATTNALLIKDFICWFFYQLYHANYEYLDHVSTEAFNALKNAQFLAIQAGKDVADFLVGEAEAVQDEVDAVLDVLEGPGKRDDLASAVNGADAGKFLHSTPETKGMLIYQVTQHQALDWTDPSNYSYGRAYHHRKEAVLKVLRTVQTVAEWRNVFQHMTPNGGSTSGDVAEKYVKDFMGLGFSDMSPDMDEIAARLKVQPSRGYAVAMNDTREYAMNTEDHPYFGMPGGMNAWGGGGEVGLA